MYVLILCLPLLSFFYAAALGFYFGRSTASILCVMCLGLSFLLSLFIFYEVGLCGLWVNFPLFTWTVLDLFPITFGLLFDSLTATMLLIITTISFFVHLYSIEYMSHDPFLTRFMSYLSLFTFFMLVLVTADNFLQLFLGWEGVGLCSYLLINFWFTRILANKAALKAMIMNRIADVFFIIAIFLFLLYFGTTDFTMIFSLFEPLMFWKIYFYFFSWKFSLADALAFFLFCGAIGKSAQLGLHTWLPDAMEGPTPVSALLHAATMVTAGVFLIIRGSPIFELSPFSLFLVALAGGLTAFFFSFSAVFQFDLKKVIAYSTCSQLGYMFLACGLSFYNVALFHLFNHAFFKALLFLSAGAIIHALNDEQDMRRMGALLNFLPFVFFCMLFGSLAIMGFPFLTGFYSKDLILELLFVNYRVDFLFFYSLALLAAFFTSLYSFRLLAMVFFFKPNFFFISFPKESSSYISIALFFLAIFSLVFGYLFSDLFIGWGSYLWADSLVMLPFNAFASDVLLLSPWERNLPLFFSLGGWVLGLIFFFGAKNIPYSFFLQKKLLGLLYILYTQLRSRISSFFYFSGFFNIVYNNMFIQLYKISYHTNTKLLDKGFLEYFGPVGFYRFFYSISKDFSSLNSSVFLNIGFMLFALITIYSLSLLFNLTLFFYIIAPAVLPLAPLIIYNEFAKVL